MVDWVYRLKTFSKIPIDIQYFVYEITFKDGTQYIGKKKLVRQVKLPPLKSGLKRKSHIAYQYHGGSKKPTKEIVRKETRWKNYIGSFDKSKFKENRPLYREVLYLCKTSKEATYLEAMELFKKKAIFKEEYRNDSILGRFFFDENLKEILDEAT